MCTKGIALYLQLGSLTGAQRGCFAAGSHHALSVCLLCVCGQGANGWLRTQGSKCQFKLSHFLLFCFSTSIFAVAIPYWHSVCLLYFPVVPCFSCTLIFSWRSTEVRQDKWKLPTFCCMSSILVTLPFLQGRHGCWGVIEFLCPFLSIRPGTMSSLSWDIFGWQCSNVQCMAQFTWLCFFPQKLTKSIQCFLPVRKLYSALISHLGDRLCDREDKS